MISERLRDVLEESVGDSSTLPAVEELYALLVYAERQGRRIGDSRVRADAAVDRVMLWQWLREQIDARQLRAVDDARDDGVAWARLAGALGVETVPGAHNRVKRMRADQAVGPDGSPVRRTPAAVAAALSARAAEESEARARTRMATDRADQILKTARLMLSEAGALLVDEDGEATFWLESLGEILDDVDEAGMFTEAQIASLAACLSAANREIQRHARSCGLPPARTPLAQRALDTAVRLSVSAG